MATPPEQSNSNSSLTDSWVIEDFQSLSDLEQPNLSRHDLRLLREAQKESGCSSQTSSRSSTSPVLRHSPPCLSPTSETSSKQGSSSSSVLGDRLESDIMWNWASSRIEINPPSGHMAKYIPNRRREAGADDADKSSYWKKFKAILLSSSFLSCALIVGTLVAVWCFKRPTIAFLFA